MPVQALIGTDKGGFILTSDTREQWALQGPLFKGWKVTASTRDDSGRYLVATASDVYGPALHASNDLKSWQQIEHGPAWPADSGRKLKQIWTLEAANGRIYAGVDEAGLFVSEDRGESWQPVDGLNEHPTRSAWYPGAGGLCCHAILVDPKDHDRIWVGISAVGVLRSEDGGQTWKAINEGIPALIEDKEHKEIGRCNHGLAADPDDANVIYRREHNGMFRSRDGGDTWQRIENGLGSWFGFPVAVDRRTKTLYIVPLESDEYRIPSDGAFKVFRSRNGGDSWEALTNGLPQNNAYMGVLRGAMDLDHQEPCGVYIGTTAGTLHVSADGGDSWTQIEAMLPRIASVRVLGEA